MTHLILVGLSHKMAPVEVRERLSFEATTLPQALDAACNALGEVVILSTCNRTEVYATCGRETDGYDCSIRFLSEYHRLPVAEFAPYLYSLCDGEAVKHLFAVATGSDSLVLGEPQILGQVKAAYECAVASQSAGVVLSTLFRQAIEVGKRARSETGISRSAVSVSFAAVELARKVFGDLCQREVLVVGAGETGELVAKTLLDCGARAIIVANRTRARAEAIAVRFGGRVIDFEHLQHGLLRADIVISSTAAPHYVVHRETVESVMRARHGRPLFFVDIAVPRDVDPEVQSVENVFLYDIDDLRAVVEGNLRERAREALKVERIVEEEVGRFFGWRGGRQAAPTIAALRRRADEVRRAEVARACARLEADDPRVAAVLDAMAGAIVNKLLHQPTVRLKQRVTTGGGDGTAYLEVVRDLFDLPPA